MVDADQKPGDASQKPNIQQNIRTRAYLLSELEGRPEGGADQFWHRARELIESESHSAYPPAQSRGHRRQAPRAHAGPRRQLHRRRPA